MDPIQTTFLPAPSPTLEDKSTLHLSYSKFMGDDEVQSVRFDEFYCCRRKNFKSWRALRRIEARRRDILTRVELPMWRILLSWNGTCLKALCLDWLIWVSIGIFVGIRVMARNPNLIPAVVNPLEDTNINILGGFLSFFLVFFVNQTQTRYNDMYKLAKAVAGRLQDIVGLASTHLPPLHAKRIARFTNAAHVIAYAGLKGPYTKKNFFNAINEEYFLLTPNELEKLEKSHTIGTGSGVFKKLVVWCQREVNRAYKERKDSYEEVTMQLKILDFRAAVDGIYDYLDQPVHFFYIHFLCLLSALYLPLFAIDHAFKAGWGDECNIFLDIVDGVIVVLQSFFVVGLRLLGQKMIDPMGEDCEDLSVLTYVLATLEDSSIIMNTEVPPLEKN